VTLGLDLCQDLERGIIVGYAIGIEKAVVEKALSAAWLSRVTSKPATKGRIKTSQSERPYSYQISGCEQGDFRFLNIFCLPFSAIAC
jgi:hypothetical protein